MSKRSCSLILLPQKLRWPDKLLVTLKGLSKNGFLFFGARGGRVTRKAWRQRAHRPAAGHKIIPKYFDKIRRKQSNHPTVATQSARPPRPVASIEAFNQITFHEPQISFCFSTPRVYSSTPAWKFCGKLLWFRRHCDRQEGDTGSASAVGIVAQSWHEAGIFEKICPQIQQSSRKEKYRGSCSEVAVNMRQICS